MGLSRHAIGDEGVNTQSRAAPRQNEGYPGKEEDDVGAGEIRRGVKTHREKQTQRDQQPPDSGDPRPEADQSAHAHGNLDKGHHDPDRLGDSF
jgi:hypothetical protein